MDSLERDKRNAKDRERRARNTVSCLLEDLEVKKILNDELKERLDIYSGEVKMTPFLLFFFFLPSNVN